MRYTVMVISNAKQVSVEIIDNQHLRVRVNTPAKEGKANKKLILILAKHFEVPRSCVTILKGHTSRKKIIEVLSL